MDANHPALPDAPTILERLAALPPELQRNVLLELLSAPRSACALALFVPDWGVCAHGADPVNAIYDLQRVDVYTRAGGGGSSGTFESGVAHGGADHVFFRLRDPRAERALAGLRLGARFPLATAWALRDLERDRLRCLAQVLPRGPDDEIGKCMAGGALVFAETASPDGGGDSVSQTCEQPPRHLMFNSIPRDPWRQLRLRRDPRTRAGFELRLLVETGTHALEEVDWAAMPRLETVFLDLRAYGGGGTEEDGIRRGAARMGRGGLRLGCLVIAGLRSGTRYARPAGWERCDWEADEREVDGGTNWVKVFCGAVREGGRLVFVERRMLDVNWEGWRMRAEKEGLLPVPGFEEARRGEAAYLGHVEKVLGEGDGTAGEGDR